MLTFPQELQVGAKETFCLSLYNITSDITVNVNISCYDKIIQHQPDTFQKGKLIYVTDGRTDTANSITVPQMTAIITNNV